MADASAEGGAVEAAGEKPAPRGGEAVVSFTTNLPLRYQVPADELVVPSDLARYGLSEVVNRLLDFERPVPFDFLVDGEFLRGTVREFLEARKLSSEKVLRLEYVIALRQPEPALVDEVPEWISGISPLLPLPCASFVAAAFDGTLRFYANNRSQLITKLSDSAITAVAAQHIGRGSSSIVLAACKDGAARCCAVECGEGGEDTTVKVGPTTALRGPGGTKSLESVAISEDASVMATAGWDLEVLLWNTPPELTHASPDEAVGSRKRKAPDSIEAVDVVPKFTLKGHAQTVTALQFGARSRYPFTLLSSSWDCSLRVWDTAAASCVCNWTVARAVTSFSLSPDAPPQLATAHEDGHVSIWDIRAAPLPGSSGALSLDSTSGLPLASAQMPHKRLTSEVVWCPRDVNRIASVGHDGRFCVLDPRSPKMPLQSIRLGKAGLCPTKLMCAAWLSRHHAAVGGSDGRVVRIAVGGDGESDELNQ